MLVADAIFSYEDQGMSKDVEVKRVKERWGGGVHRGGWGLSEELGLKTLIDICWRCLVWSVLPPSEEM